MTLELSEIAGLLDELEKLEKANPKTNTLEFNRKNRVLHLLEEVTLTGIQVAGLGQYGYHIITEEHIQNSSEYAELKEEHDNLQRRYDNLKGRYYELVNIVKKEFNREFRLKELLNRQREEEEKERLI